MLFLRNHYQKFLILFFLSNLNAADFPECPPRALSGKEFSTLKLQLQNFFGDQEHPERKDIQEKIFPKGLPQTLPEYLANNPRVAYLSYFSALEAQRLEQEKQELLRQQELAQKEIQNLNEELERISERGSVFTGDTSADSCLTLESFEDVGFRNHGLAGLVQYYNEKKNHYESLDQKKSAKKLLKIIGTIRTLLKEENEGPEENEATQKPFINSDVEEFCNELLEDEQDIKRRLVRQQLQVFQDALAAPLPTIFEEINEVCSKAAETVDLQVAAIVAEMLGSIVDQVSALAVAVVDNDLTAAEIFQDASVGSEETIPLQTSSELDESVTSETSDSISSKTAENDDDDSSAEGSVVGYEDGDLNEAAFTGDLSDDESEIEGEHEDEIHNLTPEAVVRDVLVAQEPTQETEAIEILQPALAVPHVIPIQQQPVVSQSIENLPAQAAAEKTKTKEHSLISARNLQLAQLGISVGIALASKVSDGKCTIS